ncbi:MAG: SsrA-binding protein SmpB [Verrucomicrobiales bacterium]|jgi:SsrA-binding protein|nr:SsrA-binding protein SmpB [Verrucomicrobiales bacterium]
MSGQDVQIQNHKAGRDYHVLDTLEAGIELKGTEVKSLRGGQGNLSDAFARIEKGQAFLYNFHISPYDKGNRENHEPKRIRRLLLHKQEIFKLQGMISTEGKTLIPLKAYFDKNSRFKILIGICKGKTHGDKRQDIKKRDTDREIRRAITNRMKRG